MDIPVSQQSVGPFGCMVGQGYTSICESPEGGEVPTRLGDLAEEISSTKQHIYANVVLDMR